MVKIILQKRSPADEDLYCPALFCDGCGEHIDEIGQANYYFDVDDQGDPVGEVLVMHKQCGRLLELKRDKSYMSDNLKRLLDTLPMNATPVKTWKKSRK